MLVNILIDKKAPKLIYIAVRNKTVTNTLVQRKHKEENEQHR